MEMTTRDPGTIRTSVCGAQPCSCLRLIPVCCVSWLCDRFGGLQEKRVRFAEIVVAQQSRRSSPGQRAVFVVEDEADDDQASTGASLQSHHHRDSFRAPKQVPDRPTCIRMELHHACVGG